MKFGDFVIFLCSSQNIWTIVKFELKRYFLTRIFFFLCCAMICWQLKSKTVQKLLTISFFIWQFSAMCCFFWLKILFRYNFDQTFFYFQAVLEIHDELAAQIQNSTEVVEYIDGVSTIAEDDDENSTLTSIGEVMYMAEKEFWWEFFTNSWLFLVL